MMKKCYIGIDISDFSIEIVQLNDSESVSLSRVLLPEGVIEKGVVINEGILGNNIKEAFEKGIPASLGQDCKRCVVVTIPKRQVYVKTFTEKSNTEKSNTIQEISKQLSTIVPIDIAQLEIVYRKQVYGPHISILTAGVSKDVLEGYKNAFVKANVIPQKITIESEALLQSLGNVKESALVIDIGDSTTHIYALDIGGVVSFSIIYPLGVSHAEKALESKLSISKSDARKLIQDVGLDYERENDEVLYILFNVFSGLILDVKKSQKLFLEKGLKKITSVILIGGGSHIPKIDEYLSYHLKQTVVLGEKKLPREITELDTNSFFYVGAYGAALLSKTNSECVDFLYKQKDATEDIQKKIQIKTIPNKKVFFIGLVMILVTIGTLLFLYL